MFNIKNFTILSDGTMKRMAISYDELNDTGKVISSNIKINRIITDETMLGYVSELEAYALSIVENQ